MTDADRKKAERARKRAAGLVPIEVWVKPEHVAKVRAFIAQLETQEAEDGTTP